MAKDAITMFKEAAAQLQQEEAYLALEGTRKKNDEDEALAAADWRVQSCAHRPEQRAFQKRGQGPGEGQRAECEGEPGCTTTSWQTSSMAAYNEAKG